MTVMGSRPLPRWFFPAGLAAVAGVGYLLGGATLPPPPNAKAAKSRADSEMALRNETAKEDFEALKQLGWDAAWDRNVGSEQWTRIRAMDLPQLKALLAAAGEPEYSGFSCFREIYLRWGEIDPEGALADLAAKGRADPDLEDAVLFSWLKSDPERALAKLATMPPREASQTNAFAAHALIVNFPDTALVRARAVSASVLKSVAWQLYDTAVVRGGKDRDSYLKELAQNQDPGIVAAAARPLFWDWSCKDTRAALQGLESFEWPVENIASLREEMLRNWRKDEAVEWLVAKEGLGTSKLQTSLIADWVYSDSNKALDWLEQQGADSGHYRAIISVIESLPGRNPPTERKLGYVQRLIERWRSIDSEAVEAWLAETEGGLGGERQK